MDQQTAAVVVGIESRPGQQRLVEAAAAEAAARACPLVVVTVVPGVRGGHGDVGELLAEERRLAEDAASGLAAALSDAQTRHPELVLRGASVPEDAPDDLTGVLPAARLLVVGGRGTSGRRAFTLGSVSRRLLQGLDCPVLVVPGDGGSAGAARPVLAGVQDDDLAPLVLAAAAEAAATRGGRLQVLHAYTRRPGEGDDEALTRADRLCADLIERAGLPAALQVERLVTLDAAGSALVRGSAEASVLVVGSRGPLALAGLALESVSAAVLHDARCPVLVVPRRSNRRESSRGGAAVPAGRSASAAPQLSGRGSP